jgi:segregation and condensation protein A
MVKDNAPETEDFAPSSYTVELERIFSGPMDLLLHLVREQEVEIHEVEIHRVVRDYLGYLKALAAVDIEAAADFVVMAATLMAIKARSLLPKEELDLEEELDPKDELIQRLVEYRRFRAAAEDLERRFADRELFYERGWRREVEQNREEPTLDFSDLTAFDLLAKWSRLQREVLANRPHKVMGDPRPIRFYLDRLVERLRSHQRLDLRRLVDDKHIEGPERDVLIGSFCAVLELAKLGLVALTQETPERPLEFTLRDDLPDNLDDLLKNAQIDEPDAETQARAEALADALLGGSNVDSGAPEAS